MSDSITVPLLDLKAQFDTLRDEIFTVMKDVVESQWFIMGPEVKGLEDDVAAYCGTTRAIGCASGSDALLLALMAMDIGQGDEVICPTYTFFATAGSIHRLGATPVFTDIDPVTYNMCPDSLRAAIKKCSNLKAIIPVHLYGQVANLDEILAIAKEAGVPVIEDAAQAIGATDTTGARAGSRGDIGCFSFFPSKNLGAFGDGGICTTNTDTYGDRINILRNHGGQPKYYHRIVGLNSRLDALQAAVLRVKLPHLDSWSGGRQRNAAHYDKMFKDAGAETSATGVHDGGLPLRTPHPAPKGATHIYNQYVIRVPADLRDQLRDELKAKNIGTEIYYPVPLHLQDCFKDLGYSEGDLPHAEAAAKETLALPIYPELTQEQREHVARTVIAFVNKHAAAAV